MRRILFQRSTSSKSSKLSAFLLLVALHCTACARLDQDAEFQVLQENLHTLNDAELSWTRGDFPDTQTTTMVQRLLDSGLTSESAVRIALVNNAELQAHLEKFGITQAALIQGGLLGNPRFEAEVHLEGQGIGTATNLNLIEEVVHIAQLPLRQQIAEESIEAARYELVGLIQEFISRVSAGFYQYEAALEVLQLEEAHLQAASAALEFTEQLRKAGNVSDSKPLRARMELAEAQSRRDQREMDLVEAREALQVLLGLWGLQTQWQSAQKLQPLPETEVAWKTLVPIALESRSDLKQLEHELQAAGATANMTRAFRLLPTFELGIDFEGEDSGRVLPGPNVSFPVPLFRQGQTEVAQDTGRLRELERRYYALAVQIRSEVRLAYAKLIHARRIAQRHRDALRPLSRELVSKAQLEYNAMHLSVDGLLAERKKQTDIEQSERDALRDYWIARAHLERVLGRSIPPVDLTRTSSSRELKE